ncbi:hypothetical protein Syun_018906 [Stephania yunnanensis]|uniref:Uncharacterized protein n=1 Tax=Stephania yunnanensis TaxID=152371 RepID=A0AAP0IT42_9MAGN
MDWIITCVIRPLVNVNPSLPLLHDSMTECRAGLRFGSGILHLGCKVSMESKILNDFEQKANTTSEFLLLLQPLGRKRLSRAVHFGVGLVLVVLVQFDQVVSGMKRERRATTLRQLVRQEDSCNHSAKIWEKAMHGDSRPTSPSPPPPPPPQSNSTIASPSPTTTGFFIARAMPGALFTWHRA